MRAARAASRLGFFEAFLCNADKRCDFVIVDSIVLAEGDDAAAPLNLTMVVSTYFSAVSDAR